MVILLKSWRGNIVVYIVIHYYWALVLVSEFTQEYAEKIYSWESIPGMWFEELFAGNSEEFPQILSTFSPVFLQNWQQKIPWNWLQEIPWIEL